MDRYEQRTPWGFITLILGGIATVVTVVFLLMTTYTVDQSEVAVALRNGAVTSVEKAGRHYRLPIIDDYVKVSLKAEAVVFDKLSIYSRDQQAAMVTVSVAYRADPAKVALLYERYGSVKGAFDVIVPRAINEEVKTVFGQYNAATAISDRGGLNDAVRKAVMSKVGTTGPLIIESIQVENIDFSDAYEAAIESRMQAEVQVQQRMQDLQKEKVQADIAVTQAQAIADSTLAKAKAEALAITLKGNAEADAIKSKGAALAGNPSLVGLITAERWNGTLPSTMLPNQGVPMLNLGR